jgi:hypothetical protein
MADRRRAALLALLFALAGCRLPFLSGKPPKPLSPEVIARFSSQAHELGRAPGGPTLVQVTRTMASAVNALPAVPRGGELAQQIRVQAKALSERGDDPAIARTALDAALTALQSCKPVGSEHERDEAAFAARQAVERVGPGEPAGTLEEAYRVLARGMLLVTGGRAAREGQRDLDALVSQLAVQEPEEARRTGAQAVVALADALGTLPSPPKHAGARVRDLRERADRLAAAPPLDYSRQLKDALGKTVDTLEQANLAPAARQLLAEARRATGEIRPDRPFDLQRAAAQDALRALADTITVAKLG